MSGSEQLTKESWVRDVAARAGLDDVNLVERALVENGVLPTPTLNARRTISVEVVHFAGMKDLEGATRLSPRIEEPFSFTHRLAPGLTAFGTRGINDGGKSSVLHVISWALRGRTDLQPDVRRWLRHAAVEMKVAGERLLVLWLVRGSQPEGAIYSLPANIEIDWDGVDAASLQTLTAGDVEEPIEISTSEASTFIPVPAGAQAIGSFDNAAQFEIAIGDVMMQRLGLDPIAQWSQVAEHARIDDTDGRVSEHGWPTYSQAMIITDPSKNVVLGEEAVVATRLLQMYLGTHWASAAATATAREAQLDAKLGTFRRRATQDQEARSAGIGELSEAVTRQRESLQMLPPETDDFEDVAAELVRAAHDFSVADDARTRAMRALSFAVRQLEDGRAEEYALGEAAVTRRFWHSLKPTCCPRCDAQVDQERWDREQDGKCSLCDSDLHLDVVGVDDTAGVSSLTDDYVQHELRPRTDAELQALLDSADSLDSAGSELDPDTLDDVSLARLDVLQLTSRVQELTARLSLAEESFAKAETGLAAAQTRASAVDAAAARQRRNAELALARLEGELAERQRTATIAQDPAFAEATSEKQIIHAARDLAVERRTADQRELLALASQQITELGRRLGVAQLESAELRGNTHLPVVKGGAQQTFGSLTEGEKVRLKVAVVVALLRVGTNAGVGRHPGLIIVDSLGREEMNLDQFSDALRELSTVATEIPELQVIVASAHGDILERTLEDGAVRIAGAGATLW